jgi:glycosyltransferase involved in cell wall biosynthesis
VIARLNVGGPALHATIVNDRLRRRGFDTLLVYGTPSEKEGDLHDAVWQRSLPQLHIPELGRRLKPWSDAVALWKLCRLMFRERPDVVHTHTAKAGALGRIAAAAYNLTRPKHRRAVVVHTFHGHVLAGYFGRAANLAVRCTERLLARLTDTVITISERQRTDIVERFAIAPSQKVVVVPLGLELDSLLALPVPREAAADRFGFPAGHILFGYVGRLVPIKDLQTLLDAYAMVAGRGDVGLIIAGDGDMRAELEKTARRNQIAGHLRFVGWQTDLCAVYRALDVVVLSSLNEGTPVTLIEAMAAGLPAVSTAVGGVPDIVADGETGLLVPPRDPERMARAMMTLAEHPSLRRQLGSTARERVQGRFDAERLISDLASLYDRAIREKRGTA